MAITTAIQTLPPSRPFNKVLTTPPILGVGASYYNPSLPTQSVSRLLRAHQQASLNSIYGSFGFSGRNSGSRLYGGPHGGYAYTYDHRAGYRIHVETREIKYFSTEQINEMISNYNSTNEYRIFEENYRHSPIFTKKYDAAIFDLKEEIQNHQKILSQFKKRKYQSQPYNRKNYKFEGYQNNKFEQIKNLQTKINSEDAIERLKKEIAQVAIDHPEWLI